MPEPRGYRPLLVQSGMRNFWHDFGMTTAHLVGIIGMCNQQVTRNQRRSFFISNGDKVKVDTSEARYVQRAQ